MTLLSKKISRAIFLLFLIISTLLIIFLISNITFLFIVHEGLDKPSKAYYLTTERIYKILSKRDLGSYLVNNIKSNNKPYMAKFYYHCIGIIGDQEAIPFLITSIHNYEKKPDSFLIKHSIISSMGLIGSKKFVPILKKYLDNYDDYNEFPSRYDIAVSYYLITGERYIYATELGSESKINLIEELVNAREVIVNSKNRKRTINEMIILDKLNRPPDDWKK